MILQQPICITPRLLPGLSIGGGHVSIEYAGRAGDDGCARYCYYIDLPGGAEHSADDLQSGCCGGSLQEGLSSLLSFLSACGESYRYRIDNPNSQPENLDLFPADVAEWCYLYNDEIGALSIELEETDGLIEE